MARNQRPRMRDQLQREGLRVGAAQSDDADAAASGWRGDRDDRVLGGKGHADRARCYLRAEIITVFENASPTLSVVAPGISATAICTMRRSYGFSGPSC